jgi:predicted tellurium resistance membrane protein TerC
MSHWAKDGAEMLTINGLISIITLSVLEIVLGIDNIIFISITADKLPRNQQKRGRTIGLVLALAIRCIMLFFISLIAGAIHPLFTFSEKFGVSGRGLILFGGGIFLLIKTWKEIQEKMNGHDQDAMGPKVKKVSFANIVMQIVLIDIVFSFDSILTAVGLSGNILIMITAVVISMILMILFSGVVSDFINKNPSIKMLALGFLIVIGGILTAEAVVDGFNCMIPENTPPGIRHQKEIHINKNYVYAALAFALFIEMLNMRERKKKQQRNFGD